MQLKKTVEVFIEKQDIWQEPLLKFRDILLKTELEETIKWGVPVYTHKGKHVVGMSAFKSYVGLWFFQGAFLKDSKKILINAQEGKTKALRQLRFTSTEEIDYNVIKEYIAEAIQNQKDGKEIKPDKKNPLIISGELKSVLETDPTLKTTFEQLKPFKQREYAEYISEAKRKETKRKRLDKIIPMIKQKIGLSDKYRK